MEYYEQCVAFKVPVSGVAWISENQWWPVQVRMIRAAEWWGMTCFRKSEPLLYRTCPQVHIHSLRVTVFTHSFLLHQCNTLLWAMMSLFPVTALPNPPPCSWLSLLLAAGDLESNLPEDTLPGGRPALLVLSMDPISTWALQRTPNHRITCPLSQPDCRRQVTPSPHLDCVNRELVIMKNKNKQNSGGLKWLEIKK